MDERMVKILRDMPYAVAGETLKFTRREKASIFGDPGVLYVPERRDRSIGVVIHEKDYKEMIEDGWIKEIDPDPLTSFLDERFGKVALLNSQDLSKAVDEFFFNDPKKRGLLELFNRCVPNGPKMLDDVIEILRT